MNMLIFTLLVIRIWVYILDWELPEGKDTPFVVLEQITGPEPHTALQPRTQQCAPSTPSFLHQPSLRILALRSLYKALRDRLCVLVFFSWFLVLCCEGSRCSINTY